MSNRIVVKGIECLSQSTSLFLFPIFSVVSGTEGRFLLSCTKNPHTLIQRLFSQRSLEMVTAITARDKALSLCQLGSVASVLMVVVGFAGNSEGASPPSHPSPYGILKIHFHIKKTAK